MVATAQRHLSEAAAKLEVWRPRRRRLDSQGEAGAHAASISSWSMRWRTSMCPLHLPHKPPAPSDDAVPEDGELQLFLPGALTGERPKGGRLEWQVLGRPRPRRPKRELRSRATARIPGNPQRLLRTADGIGTSNGH